MGKYEKAKADYCEWIKVYPFTPVDLEGEVWVSVAGYGKNSVSNFGRVKSFAYGRETILTPVVTNNGYLSVGVYEILPKKKILEEIRRKIRDEYQRNVPGAGSKTLARKYHCDPSTILSIVKEK